MSVTKYSSSSGLSMFAPSLRAFLGSMCVSANNPSIPTAAAALAKIGAKELSPELFPFAPPAFARYEWRQKSQGQTLA